MVGAIAVMVAVAGVPVCSASDGRVGAGAAQSVVVRSGETLRELYESGVVFAAFLESARERKALWDGNWSRAAVPAELLARARAVGGAWRLLAVAVDSCSDSVSTIPYIAKLVEQVAGLDLRIIDSSRGRAIMESHRTPDDRAATPTLLLLDEAWQEAGCWIERPRELQRWVREKQEQLGQHELTAQKMAWYAEDGGRATVREIVELMEAAAAGDRICASDPARR